MLPRALGMVPKREHIPLLQKCAIFEFQFGDAERGKALFEEMCHAYPNRTDLWSVYIDQCRKKSSAKDMRQLFDRTYAKFLSLNAEKGSTGKRVKKMKFLFQKWLAFEEDCGDEAAAESVREKAKQYVEQEDV